ncbi:hypothetical protein UA08_00085 [Talaromyces atroroseus]|uniref:Poly A polymerase head domain-containing protein n=1 Tax=Talaromyces atroroseus TaxID=1441469 RepID=A0A225B096_TALAT|nr:hypothetical protein UA08_00085 [Talaromyces atroroseus]OKL64124.1 hypothetical protein UA08_00085 [Talaromyces atroroseus]
MDTTKSKSESEEFESEPPNKKIKRIDSSDPDQQTVFSSSTRKPAMECNRISYQVDLLPAEQLLRELLLDCREHILQTRAATSTKSTAHEEDSKGEIESPKIEMWFVGGWVRDKLLGKQSADIDVALSSAMTGSAFARHLEDQFLAEGGNTAAKYKQEAARRGVETAEIRGFYHIERNPGKGKHLETTSAQIFGLEVDFVNLRSESLYQEQEKKKETLTFTSAPEEDALRRDANINAIFYNLETQQIEDHTKKGLTDIQSRVLRTPLDARITFTDDPLRMLRLIRLASTLGGGFTIDDADGTQQAMKDPEIQLALRTRISPERIGGEVKKMLMGPDPVAAFRWIYELGLYGTVFLDFGQESLDMRRGGGDDSGHPWPATWLRACVALAELLLNADSDVAKEIAQTEDREMVWLMAAWSPLVQLRGDVNADGTIVKAAAKAINAATKKWKALGESFKNMDDIRSTIDAVNHHSNPPPRRSTIGVAIRSWGVTWRLQALYSLLCELMATPEEQHDQLTNRYAVFLRCVSSHDLHDAATLKPILGGADIKSMFGLKKSGAFMKPVFDAVLRWQFDHAGATRAEAEAWLRSEKASLNIPDSDALIGCPPETR